MIRYMERQGEVVIVHFEDDETGRAYKPAQAWAEQYAAEHGLVLRPGSDQWGPR